MNSFKFELLELFPAVFWAIIRRRRSALARRLAAPPYIVATATSAAFSPGSISFFFQLLYPKVRHFRHAETSTSAV